MESGTKGTENEEEEKYSSPKIRKQNGQYHRYRPLFPQLHIVSQCSRKIP
jgi:hypothetical protein